MKCKKCNKRMRKDEPYRVFHKYKGICKKCFRELKQESKSTGIRGQPSWLDKLITK